jgi:hypothetical protein
MQTAYEMDCLRMAIHNALETPGYYHLDSEHRLLVVAKESLKMGVEMYAYSKLGTMYVGTTGRTLHDAKAAIDAAIPHTRVTK